MANEKRLLAIKGNCNYCNKIVAVEVPEPDPLKEIVKEPCKCGLSSDTRISRHWATAAGMAAVVGILSAFGSCHVSNMSAVDLIKAETEKMKVQLSQEVEKNAKLLEQLIRYKNIVEELRKTGIKAEEKNP